MLGISDRYSATAADAMPRNENKSVAATNVNVIAS